jgi:HSP20 family protein
MTERSEIARKEGRLRTPVVDVFETAEGVTFQFELPGVSREDIDINLEGDALSVSTHADIKQAEHGEPVLQEFTPANFSREFVLSRDLDRENVQASWHDGVLALMVPKAAAAKARKIQISAQ